MSRAKTSSDANVSPPEFVRLTFPDQGAFEREIASNLRFGQVFVRESLKFPVLTEGVIVIVHPLSQRELRLPAQIVMVNGDGTGLALRAFGRPELERLEAFAREPGPAAAPRRASSGEMPRPTRASASNSQDGSRVAPNPSSQSSAANVAARARSPMPPQPTAAAPSARTANSGVQRLALQPAAAGGQPRAPSSTANPAVRRTESSAAFRAAREVDASPARPRSSAKISAQRPAQEINRPDVESERSHNGPQPTAARARTASKLTHAAVQPPQPPQPQPQPMAAAPSSVANPRVREPEVPTAKLIEARVAPKAALRDQEDDWSDFEHGPEPGVLAPTRETAGGAAAPTPLPAALAADEDDWSDFEHGPEPSAVAAPVNVVAEVEPAIEADSLSIPYDLESARDRAPSAAFVSSPHTAVTHRPPPKEDEPPEDESRERR